MSLHSIEVEPIAGALGAVVRGVNIAEIDDTTFDEVHAAWLDNLVLFFPEQHLTPEQQISFARRIGDIHFHPFMNGLPDHPEILELLKTPKDSYTFGSRWHSDQMFNPCPAKATMLYAKETPVGGGDTLFANMYMAHDSLSEAMQAMLADLKTYNVGSRTRTQRYGADSSMGSKVRDPGNQPTEAAHPLLRTHPETGRKALYIGSHSQRLDGFSDAESEPLLSYLKAHSVRPEFTCRYRWQPGDVALWDNRCTQHHAIADYAGQTRRMHRVTIAGDEPF